MCGITGLVYVRGRGQPDRELLKRMNARLSHRGPDGDGFHFSDGVALGHRRLSIIDIEGGAQPVYNEDRSVVVTYNGEIYNFQELRRELEAAGHIFASRCDTEVIAHGWEEWGPDCVRRFNGMFAFGIWDEKKQVLFLARDRIGIKPLYYTCLPDGAIGFASELKALQEIPQLGRRLDPRAVDDFFTFGYVPDPKTIWADVRKLPPGNVLLAKRGGAWPEPQRYWDVPLNKPSSPADDGLYGSLRSNLINAVDRRLVADVPLGSFLSGGIDSSAVVAAMRQIGVPRLETCSIGFSEPRYDESKYASLVASLKDTVHHRENVTPFSLDLVDKLTGIYDEPFADSSALPTYAVCGLARKHVTVCLSGDGGDESFVGYRRYRMFANEERLRRLLPLDVRRPVFGAIGSMYPKADWAPQVFRGKATFQALAEPPHMAYLRAIALFNIDKRRELFTPEFNEVLGDYSSNRVFEHLLDGQEFEDAMRMVQYLDFHTYLPGDILTKVDRASMAHSLEVRVPFLDHTFVEWAAGVPTKHKLHKGQTKYVLKKALEPLLPAEVLYRKKMGFAVPLDIWFRGELFDLLDQRFSELETMPGNVLNVPYIRSLLMEHKSGVRNYSAVLWALLMFSSFLQQHGEGVTL